MSEKITPALLSAGKAAEFIGVAERTFHTIRNQPGFPLPVEVAGTNLRRWRVSELLAWQEQLPRAPMKLPEPRQLLATKPAGAGRREARGHG